MSVSCVCVCVVCVEATNENQQDSRIDSLEIRSDTVDPLRVRNGTKRAVCLTIVVVVDGCGSGSGSGCGCGWLWSIRVESLKS